MIADAPVGVFAWVRSDGRPAACAVTPYVVDGAAVVTSTLALPTKAFAVQRDARVALLAGGRLVRGRATVRVDPTPAWFDAHLRAAERAKYPPARSLLAIPGHRRLLPWYVGRIVIAIDEPEAVSVVAGDDRVTATQTAPDGPTIVPLAVAPGAPEVARLPVAALADGPVDVLVHEETAGFAELLQLHVRGAIVDGRLVAPTVTGSLTPSEPGAFDQLRTLRALGREARRLRPRVEALPRVERERPRVP